MTSNKQSELYFSIYFLYSFSFDKNRREAKKVTVINSKLKFAELYSKKNEATESKDKSKRPAITQTSSSLYNYVMAKGPDGPSFAVAREKNNN